jgi:hypothetical protein
LDWGRLSVRTDRFWMRVSTAAAVSAKPKGAVRGYRLAMWLAKAFCSPPGVVKMLPLPGARLTRAGAARRLNG